MAPSADTASPAGGAAAWLVPEAACGAPFEQRLLEIVAEEQPALLLPGRDEDVAALAALGQAQPALAPACWPARQAVHG